MIDITKNKRVFSENGRQDSSARMMARLVTGLAAGVTFLFSTSSNCLWNPLTLLFNGYRG
jgi:hypothetical protein